MAVSCYRIGKQSGLHVRKAPKAGDGHGHLRSTVGGNSDSVTRQERSCPLPSTYLWDLGPEFPYLQK